MARLNSRRISEPQIAQRDGHGGRDGLLWLLGIAAREQALRLNDSARGDLRLAGE